MISTNAVNAQSKKTLADIVNSQPWFKKIAILRIIHGWTMEEAADRCGTDTRVFWCWELGKNMPRRVSKQAIARAFDVDEKTIFS